MGVCLRRARVLYHFMYGSPLCRLRCNVWARRGGIRSTEVLRSFLVSRPGNSRSHSLAGVSESGLYGLRAMCRDRVCIVKKAKVNFHQRRECLRILLQGFADCRSSKDVGTDQSAEAVPTPILDNLLQPRPWGLDISTNDIGFPWPYVSNCTTLHARANAANYPTCSDITRRHVVGRDSVETLTLRQVCILILSTTFCIPFPEALF